jgi:DNA (cytosine-5)-methyltransferase 1
MLTVLDLFSGIGGFSLGLERTGGFKTVAFCEIDPFCRKVLAKHWPGVPIYEDVRALKCLPGFADVVCGGFPCQDISHAGSGKGIGGKRSGLWGELHRIIGEVRPRYALVENVPRLLSGGSGAWMGKVLGDLAAIGYDAEWHCIPASAVGAPHIRDRVWIIAYPQHSDADRIRPHHPARNVRATEPSDQQSRHAGALRRLISNRNGVRELQPEGGERDERGRIGNGHRWPAEPAMDRMAYGVPNGVDRIRALGNTVVPAIPELIGRAILKAEGLTA